MKAKIYSLTHKPFDPPSDPLYQPLSVFEDSGDNIADKNCYYSELTGVYWVWKNSTADIVGICHYRRYLLNEAGALYTTGDIERDLRDHDLITTKLLTLNFPYEYGFSKNHKPYYLEELDKLLSEKYSEIHPVYRRLVEDVHTYFGNMMICSRTLFDEYCEWLFGILFELEERIVIDEPDAYHRRIFGFISEFLLYVFCEYKSLKIKHAMVGMVGEKTEVRSIKAEMSAILIGGDVAGAKAYFLEEHKKRPDILMEASDIGWELHLLMEAVSIAEHEIDAGHAPFFTNMSTAEDIYLYLRALNKAASSSGDYAHLTPKPSAEAVFVARTLAKAAADVLQ